MGARGDGLNTLGTDTLHKNYVYSTLQLFPYYMCSTVSMPPKLLVELVQQCGQDLESFLHDRESAVLIVSMVHTAVTKPTHLGREEKRERKGRGRGGRT